MRKITIEIDEQDYIEIINNTHHGQLSILIRKYIKALLWLYHNDKKMSVMKWLYGKENLTLKQVSKDE